MKNVRRIIVSILSIVYIILVLMNIEIPRNIFIILIGIILINQVIDEWNIYIETKKKIHLLIPITFLIIVVLTILKLLMQ